jgi:CRP-like cAMP-binding protein
VAIKLMESSGIPVAPLIDALTRTYCAGSTTLGRSIRPAPADYSVAIRDDIDLDYDMPPREVALGLARMAAYTDNIQKYPALVPPLAIFSALHETAFRRLISLLKLRRIRAGEAIIREKEAGDAMYFVARGEVRVSKMSAADGAPKEIRIARLGPGSLFGEMALLSSEPRGASVHAEGVVDVLALSRDQVGALAVEVPDIQGAMMRFMRERMISNLLSHNPFFTHFDEESRRQLLSRFVGHDVPAGTIFIEQGKNGTGLFVILQGRAEVLKWDGQSYVAVAALGPGDVAGEISLLHEQPASATVRTVGPATLLFLAREIFYPLVEAVPSLLAHLGRLANERLMDTRTKLEQNRLTDDDFIEEVDAEPLCEAEGPLI